MSFWRFARVPSSVKTHSLSHLYGGIDEPEPKIIDVFICKLRRKLVDNGAKGLNIDTVWGQGYTLKEIRDYQALEKTG